MSAILPRYRRLRRRNRRAFTLIELSATVVLAGVLMTIAYGRLQEAVDRAKEVKAITDLKAMAVSLNARDTLPASLSEIGWAGAIDPWGRPYVYYPFPDSKGKGPPQGARKDRFLVPVNSRYDLYSVGKDGGSVAPFTAKASRDDIVVANDGGFVGRASKY